MIFLVVAFLFGMSASLAFYYAGQSFSEKKMIADRIKMLQTGAPTVMAKSDVIQDFAAFSKREPKRSLESSPYFITALLIWSAGCLFFLTQSNSGPVQYLLFLVIIPFGILDFIKIMVKRNRTEKIQRELPGALDLMVVCLEAGLAINSALVRIANEMENTPLGKELRRTADEAAAGIPLADALRGFAKRTKNPDVQTIVSAIVQAEKMGSSIALTFRVQAESLREKYKMTLREKINKIPIKILFPLVFFLFPTLFIVILGPALFSVAETLGGEF